MHLDQKSPQQTRLIQRLNFYSQEDVTNLLTKCLPHFRLKKGNAKLLLELIRMKKSYKKADWYKPRCDEIFKLMKWENHKDHVGFDWLKEGIYLTDIAKLQGNCKMSVMDNLENIGTIIKEDISKRNSNRYLRERKGLNDREVAFIVDKAKELLDNKPDDLEDKRYNQLQTAYSMYKSKTNYNYGIVRMRKIIQQLLGGN